MSNSLYFEWRRLSSILLLLLRFYLAVATGAQRDWGAVGASARMAQEGADLICRFGREDVLELARLLFDF